MSPLTQAFVAAGVALAGVGVVVLSVVVGLLALRRGGPGPMGKRIHKGLATTICGGFVVMGLSVSGFGVRAAWRDHASAAWPRVPGRITRSAIKTDHSGDGESYQPDIGYRYTVEGREWTGERISFGVEHFSSGQRFAGQYVSRYRVGAPVQVAYRPGQPEMCTLETGLTRRSLLQTTLGLFFAAFGAFMCSLFLNQEELRAPGGRPFLRVLPGFLGFGAFFGLLYWLSVS